MAHPRLLHHMTAIKPPYNVPTPSAYLASQALTPQSLDKMHAVVRQIVEERNRLAKQILSWPLVESIRGGMDANFLLVQLKGVGQMTRNQVAKCLYESMANDATHPIVIRFRGIYFIFCAYV